jgi:hypothetical protein
VKESLHCILHVSHVTVLSAEREGQHRSGGVVFEGGEWRHHTHQTL